MHNFKELKVWSKAIDLAEDIYKATKSFPSEERFGLTAQIRRCAVSISSNIAEGAGRKSNKEFLHFLSISNGSCFELQNHLIISTRLEYLSEPNSNDLLRQIVEIQKMIHSFSKTLKTQIV